MGVCLSIYPPTLAAQGGVRKGGRVIRTPSYYNNNYYYYCCYCYCYCYYCYYYYYLVLLLLLMTFPIDGKS